jgi:hypothetical protein
MIAAWLKVLQDHVLDMRVNIEARRPQATYEHLVAAPRELHLRTFKPLIQRQHLNYYLQVCRHCLQGDKFHGNIMLPQNQVLKLRPFPI